MTRSGILVSLLITAVVATSSESQAQTMLEEFDWANLNPAGTQNWTTANNWTPPTTPPGNGSYPDDPNHIDNDPNTISPVVGANLNVALTTDLNVSLNSGNVTIASLAIGVDGRSSTISGPGMLLFEQDEASRVVQIPDPDPEAEPGAMVDEVTCSFNCGQSLVKSIGNSSGSNVISAIVGSTESIDFAGTRMLQLTGGFNEIAVDVVDDNVANNTNIRSHIGTYDPSMPMESQMRLVITGQVNTVVDNLLNADMVAEDIPLMLNGGGSGTPEFLSVDNTEMGQGFPHGILDLPGGITGAGRVRIGTQSREDEAVPLSTVALYDNSYAGRTIIDRANVILKHNNAFGLTGDIINGNPANEVGFNLIVEPGPGETAQTVDRVIANNFALAHDMTVKGNHSLTLTGQATASNSAAWINLLPEGELLTLTGVMATTENITNLITFDGSGETLVRGALVNGLTPIAEANPNNSSRFRKDGSGVVRIQSSDFGNTNTFRAPSSDPNLPTILISGGNLHFSAIGDLGNTNGKVQSTGGAIGVDTGTVAAAADSAFNGRFTNFASRTVPFEGDVQSSADWDHGGLMLTNAADAAANLDFTSGNLVNFQDMSVAADEDGTTFTGTITPANIDGTYAPGNLTPGAATYRLGGGSGTLTIAATKLTGANNLLVTNGGDYKNPNGMDRTQLGMVRITGTNNSNAIKTAIMGKYQSTLQDQAVADDVALADELQYHGTTLAVSSLADGNSSIGTSTAAGDLLIQGSTLRYEGAAGSTNRLFTVGTAGATLDASGSGAINFTNAGALVMDAAESRMGDLIGDEFTTPTRSDVTIFNLPNTDDLVVGMPVSDSGGVIPADTVITNVFSPTRVGISNAIDEFAFAPDSTIDFGPFERTLTVSGDNEGNNTLAALIGDSTTGAVALEKEGVGKWILTNSNNSYSGDTSVEAGILSIASSFLHDESDVSLLTGGILDLNFAGMDDINALFFDGVQQSGGTWGSSASTAMNKNDVFFSGTGILNVSGQMVPDLPGDFNADGFVNAADYPLWRDQLGNPSDEGLNGNGDGNPGVTVTDYDFWRGNFGGGAVPPGAGAFDLGSSNVPEPSATLLLLLGAAGLLGYRHWRA